MSELFTDINHNQNVTNVKAFWLILFIILPLKINMLFLHT